MKTLKLPAFEEKNFHLTKTNDTVTALVIDDVGADSYDKYVALYLECGFEKKEERRVSGHSYAAFSDGETSVFINYFEHTSNLYVVTETGTSYFSFSSPAGESVCDAEITQMELADFGMSYVIRLTDGRFIIIDGGRSFDRDADILYKHLIKRSPTETPVVAAWFMTHPHVDHFELFINFYDKYGDKIKIEKFLYNFPRHDDAEHYPDLLDVGEFKRFGYDNSAVVRIPMMLERIALSGAEVYTPHTAQIYEIGDATFEILACMDETMHLSTNTNVSSLFMMMNLAGQKVFWTADGSFGIAKIPEKYGSRLKCDIMQIPHHGFGCGSADAEIAGYELARPSVLLLPVSEYNAYTAFCTFTKGPRFAMANAIADEIVVGTPARTLTLPYTPAEYKKEEYKRQYLRGLDNCGATAWVFTDLSTACEGDFVFTVLNTGNRPSTLSIDIFFEEGARKIRYIKAQIPSNAVKRINIIGEDVDTEAVYFNWLSLGAQGIPENAPFAVRFTSDNPVVISHANHTAAYHSQNR